MKKIIMTATVLAIIVALGYFWVAQRTSSNRDDAHILTVGTNAEYSPFSFIDHDTIVGFDIDVITEIAHRLGKRMVLKDMPFDALLPKLQLGEIQLVAAGMTATPERALRVHFTKPYLVNDPLLIITLATQKPLRTLDDLAGKTVVVNEGYTADTYLSEFKQIGLVRLGSPSEAFLALSSRRADAFAAAQSSVQSFFQRYNRDHYHIHPLDGVYDNYALAISKKHPELLEQVQHALDAMEQDGTLDRLKKKWSV